MQAQGYTETSIDRISDNQLLTLLRCLKALPADNYNSLVMQISGYKISEISHLMGWSINKTKRRLQRTKRKLRKNIKDTFYEIGC